MKATSSWLAAASLSSWALRPLPFPPWQVLRGQRGGATFQLSSGTTGTRSRTPGHGGCWFW